MKDKLTNKKKTGIFRWIIRKIILRIIISLILFLLIFSGILYFLPSTRFFKKFAGEKLTSILKSELNAKISIDEIYFGKLGYVELDQVHMLIDQDTVAYIPNLLVEVNIVDLIYNKVKVNQLVLTRPYCKMARGKDSIWNISQIAKPSNDTSSNSGGSIPIIEIDKLKIIDGNFHMIDSLSNYQAIDNNINFTNLNFNHINLNLRTRLDLSDYAMELESLALSLEEVNSGIKLNDFDIDKVEFNQDYTRISPINIKIDNNKLQVLRTELNSFNPMNPDYSDIEIASIISGIKTQKIDLALINYFSEEKLFEPKNVTLNVNILSNKGSIEINESSFSFGRSRLKFDSKIKKLYSGSMEINYSVSSGTLFNNDLIDITSNFTNFKTGFNKISINKIVGFTDLNNYNSEFEFNLDNSSINGSVTLNLNEEKYSLTTTQSKVDLAKILNDTNFRSNINGDLIINGKGYDPASMVTSTTFNSKYIKYNDYEISDLNSIINLNSNKIQIDRLLIGNELQNIFINGSLDISSIENMQYDLVADFSNFDLGDYIEGMDYELDTKLKIKGEGINPDTLVAEIETQREINLTSDAISIHNSNLDLKINNTKNKNIIFNSDFADFNVRGDFSIDDLTLLMDNEMKIIEQMVNENTKTLIDSSIVLTQHKYLPNPEVKIIADLKLKDYSVLQNSIDLSINEDLNLGFTINSDSNSINMELNKLSYDTLEMIYDNQEYLFENVSFTFKLNQKLDQNISEKLELKFIADKIINYYDTISNTRLLINNDINEYSLELAANYNSLISLFSEIKYNPKVSDNLELNKLTVNYDNKLELKSNNSLLSLNNSFLNFKEFIISGKNKESISLSGGLNIQKTTFNNLALKLENLDISDLLNLTPENELLNTLDGEIDYLNVDITGNLERPIFNVDFAGNDLIYNNILLGNISSEIHYNENLVYGDFYLFNITTGSNFSLQIKSLPIELNLSDNKSKLVEKETEMFLDISNFPLKIAEPFATGISNINGLINGSVSINGDIAVGLNYQGKFTLPNINFIVDQTNLAYFADAAIDVTNDKINIHHIDLNNYDTDLNNGSAQISGYMMLNNFEPSDFKFEVKSDKLKVLSDKTKYSIPNLFGDLVIATGKRPLFMEGTLNRPLIGGDVILKNAELKMLDQQEAVLIEKRINYVFQHQLLDTLNNIDILSDYYGSQKQSSFEQNLAYDLRLYFERSININADISNIRLNIDLNTDGLTYVADHGEIPQLIGEVFILNNQNKGNSELTFLGKTLEAGGRVSFPTGEISNPTLDIVSEYKAVTKNQVPFTVRILVSGTANIPIINFEYIYDDQPFTDHSDDDITRDAWALLLFNSRLSDLAAGSEQIDFGKETSDLADSFLSSMLSRNLSESLGFNASIDLDINDWQNTQVKIEEDLFNGRLKWEVGGTPANPQNNEISIILPLSILNENSENLRNLNFEVTKPNNPFASRQNQKQWEVSVNYKKNW